jgi:phage tail-like protein
VSELRPFATVRSGDQWIRGSFDRTFLDDEGGVVELAWTTPEPDYIVTATTPANGPFRIAGQPTAPSRLTITISDADASIAEFVVDITGKDEHGGTASAHYRKSVDGAHFQTTESFSAVTSVVGSALGGTAIGDTIVVDSGASVPGLGAGLAFDNECRLYHSVPDEGRLERVRWAAQDLLSPLVAASARMDFVEAPAGTLGDFTPSSPATALSRPRGLAVDVNDRLFIAESGADRILVFDLWSERLLRRLSLPGARPLDVAARGASVYAVLGGTASVVRLTARTDPEAVPFANLTAPSRIAVSPGGAITVLEGAGTADATIRFKDRPADDFVESHATDIEYAADDILVVALQPDRDFRCYRVAPGKRSLITVLRARGYDGLGIVATPESAPPAIGAAGRPLPPARRIGFWTAKGFRNAVAARRRYERRGRVTTYRLDSGEFQTVWGRLFLDACIPEGTDVRVHYVALDEPLEDDTMPRAAPANIAETVVRRPDLSPPMPPVSLEPGPADVTQPLHRRESGRERPWTQPPAEDPFVTYEAPIDAPAGRYLWVTLELRGNTRVSPRVRFLRAEHPSHDYLRRLPRTFSREEAVASFLRRYLALFEGFLGEVEARAVDRDLLLEPRTAPDEVLPWLASFMGLVLDERWARAPAPRGQAPVDARRPLIRECIWLFRYRGTVPGLKRFIEIYTSVPVVLIEHFRLRGLGGAVLGATGDAFSSSILGGGFRVGGTVGGEGEAPLAGSLQDAFRTHAHRFSLIVPAALDPEQLDVVRHILDVHRPAHTIFDICTVGAGMRLGLGLHLELSTVIGRTGSFATLQLDDSVLGRGAIVGRPELGTILGASRLGDDSRTG